MRLDRRPGTRVTLLTEGILTRRLQADPELAGVGCLIFDEFHERNLHGDLGLALALECQDALRPDLRILIMSATLESGALAPLLAGGEGVPGESACPVLRSEGRLWPVSTRYLPRADFSPTLIEPGSDALFSGVFARRAGNPAGRRSPCRSPRAWRATPCLARGFVSCGSGCRHSPCQRGRTQSRPVYVHCRNKPYHRGDRHCCRRRSFPDGAV